MYACTYEYDSKVAGYAVGSSADFPTPAQGLIETHIRRSILHKVGAHNQESRRNTLDGNKVKKRGYPACRHEYIPVHCQLAAGGQETETVDAAAATERRERKLERGRAAATFLSSRRSLRPPSLYTYVLPLALSLPACLHSSLRCTTGSYVEHT